MGSRTGVERDPRRKAAKPAAGLEERKGEAFVADHRASAEIQRRLAVAVGNSSVHRRQASLQRYLDRRARPSSPGQPVMQLGAKYDKLAEDAANDVDGGDYEFMSLTEDAIAEGTRELMTEHLAGKRYLDLKGRELAVPDVILSQSWGGSEGSVLLPARLQSAMQIYSGEFTPNLMHEVGHMVKGRTDVPGMKAAIAEIAKKAKVEAARDEHEDARPNPDAWEEEVRADLTGVYLRMTSGTAPAKADYAALSWADDPADGEHPPGAYRIERINEYFDTLA